MTRRAPVAATVLLLAGLAFDLVGQLGVHGHALGELDRVAHELIAIDHPPAPAATPHLDLALELEHAACSDCILGSLRSDRRTGAPSVTPLAASESFTPAREPARARRLVARRAPARAPPVG